MSATYAVFVRETDTSFLLLQPSARSAIINRVQITEARPRPFDLWVRLL
jgi:hypothetical protein